MPNGVQHLWWGNLINCEILLITTCLVWETIVLAKGGWSVHRLKEGDPKEQWFVSVFPVLFRARGPFWLTETSALLDRRARETPGVSGDHNSPTRAIKIILLLSGMKSLLTRQAADENNSFLLYLGLPPMDARFWLSQKSRFSLELMKWWYSDLLISLLRICTAWVNLWPLTSSCFCLVTQSCLTLCNPMDWSTPGFPVHHHPLELAQTHVQWVGDAIQQRWDILCCPLLFLLSICPSIRVFSNELALHIRWSKCWSLSISPSNEDSGLISLGLTGLISLQFLGLSRVFSNTAVQNHQFFSTQPSL